MFCRGQAGYRSAAESVMKQLLSFGMPLAVGFISHGSTAKKCATVMLFGTSCAYALWTGTAMSGCFS